MQLGMGSRTLTANRAVTWNVVDENIARVSTTGVLTPRRTGNSTIIATCRSTNETARFTLTVDPLLLYQSPRLPGFNEDGTIADDMLFNNWSRADIQGKHRRIRNMVRLYNNLARGPDAVFEYAQGLATTFTTQNSELRPVAQTMFQRLFDGRGADFRNSTLTNNVFNHVSTGRFMDTVKDVLLDYLGQNNGNFAGVRNTNSSVRRTLDYTRPRFNDISDNFNGLRITINDTWGNNIELLEFNQNGRDIEIRVLVTIYDHFGLDSDDTRFVEGILASTIGNGDGFAAWYVLQHYSGTSNRHNPFISYFSREFTFSTRLNN